MSQTVLAICDKDHLIECMPGGGVIGTLPGTVTGSLAGSAWEAVCRSFAEAAVLMLQSFAEAFAAMPGIDLADEGLRGVFGMSLGIAMVVAVLLLLGQVVRTAFTHDGRGIAEGLVGVGKAALACLLILTVAGAALTASDELASWITTQAFGSPQGLVDQLTTVMPDDPNMSVSLLLILSVVGICLVAVLWFELLLRNAAIAVLIATAPIAAAGQTSEVTKGWWGKLVQATIQLVILKPVIALCFAIGFKILNKPEGEDVDIATMLSGMLVLLLAALAWPAIAKFMTFTQAHVSGGTGLAALLGFAAGSASKVSAASGQTAGVSPEGFGKASEERTMAAVGARAQNGATGSGVSSIAGLGPAAIAALGLQLAQAGANTLAKGMESTAGHAGLRHNPYAHPAGAPAGGGAVSGGAALWQANAHTQATSTAAVDVSPAPVSPSIAYGDDGVREMPSHEYDERAPG